MTLDTMLLGSDRAVKFKAVDDDSNPIENATVVITARDPDAKETTPPVTNTGNVYEASVRNSKIGTWRAISEATDNAHVGVGLDEWRVIDPRGTA